MASKRAEFVFDTIRETVDNSYEKFKFLEEYKNHWEKWFQIELATSLKRKGAQDIKIEDPRCFDGRKKNTPQRVLNDYKTAQIDLVFRRKLESKGKLVGIELKQTQSLQGLKAMLEDVVKIKAIRGKDWPFREVYFVLFYYEDINNRWKYEGLLNDLLNNQKIQSEIIEFSNIDNLRCLVLYWESGPYLHQMDIDSYMKWYTEIENLMKKYELTNIAKGRAKGC